MEDTVPDEYRENNESLAIVVDWRGTLEENEVLARKLAEYMANGVTIYTCSELFNEKAHAWLKEQGLNLDYEKHVLRINKDDPDSWKELPKHTNKKPDRTILIDDFDLNCEDARRAGITALEWMGNISITELEEIMHEKGYRPVLN